MARQTQQYSDQEVRDALAALEMNAGNVLRTAKQLGLPRTTLIEWRDRMSSAVDTEKPSRVHDFAALWAEVQAAATARMLELLPQTDDLRAVATAAGIAADKHLDYAQGRKGTQVNVDARQQSVTLHVDALIQGILQARAAQELGNTVPQLPAGEQ